jgi:hypothetical protein
MVEREGLRSYPPLLEEYTTSFFLLCFLTFPLCFSFFLKKNNKRKREKGRVGRVGKVLSKLKLFSKKKYLLE